MRPEYRQLVRATVTTAVAVTVLAALSACSTSTRGTPRRAAGAEPAVSSTARIVFGRLADGVNPARRVSVRVRGGRLSAVRLVNTHTGLVVTGSESPSGTRWVSTEDLGYGKTYRLTAVAKGAAGRVTRAVRFTTLDPALQAAASFQTIGGYALIRHATYGVGIVPIVHFDHPIEDKAAVVAALQVRSVPRVSGAWYWADDQDVHFRPRHFWPAHTAVTITAKVYGVRVGPGTYGESDERTSFTVGRRQVTIADDNSPQVDKVRVYNGAGQVLRTMNTSMGQHSGEYVDGPNGRTWINFYTLDGTYTVIAHENPAHMSSESYGLPADDLHGYGTLDVPYSTKISVDGIYLHEFNSTIAQQDSGQDVSEGCLNLRTSDAEWFYDHSLLGDPVIVHGAQGAPKIALWQGGDWSVSWPTWLSGG
jgi:lipoprotein-anchoring transpeptidase ErfK/SrfK